MKQFEGLKLQHPAGEDGEVVELGDKAKGIHRASKLGAKAIDSSE